MLPRLMAEESLTTAERVSMGSGVLEKETYRRIHRRWTRAANPPKPRPMSAPRKVQAFDPDRLRELGIEVYVDGVKA